MKNMPIIDPDIFQLSSVKYYIDNALKNSNNDFVSCCLFSSSYGDNSYEPQHWLKIFDSPPLHKFTKNESIFIPTSFIPNILNSTTKNLCLNKNNDYNYNNLIASLETPIDNPYNEQSIISYHQIDYYKNDEYVLNSTVLICSNYVDDKEVIFNQELYNILHTYELNTLENDDFYKLFANNSLIPPAAIELFYEHYKKIKKVELMNNDKYLYLYINDDWIEAITVHSEIKGNWRKEMVLEDF